MTVGLALLIALHATLSCLEHSSLESQLVSHLSEILPLPTALLPIIAQYVVVTPAQPILMINGKDYPEFPTQRHINQEGSLLIWVIGKNPQRPHLPLCLSFFIFPKKPTDTPEEDDFLKICPENWYPDQLMNDLVNLHRKAYPHNKMPLSIKNKSNSKPCSRAPYITQETVTIFNDISTYELQTVNSNSREAEGGKELTIVYQAPGSSFRSVFQLTKNLSLYLQSRCVKLPRKMFPEGGFTDLTSASGRICIMTDPEPARLNSIVKKYHKQAPIIATIIAQQPQNRSITALFWKGASLSAAADYAERRKREGYITHDLGPS